MNRSLVTMARETAAFLGNWQVDAPGKPWHGGMVHALGQYCGKHWGPGLEGQVDTGMATGNSLAALELWLAAMPLEGGGRVLPWLRVRLDPGRGRRRAADGNAESFSILRHATTLGFLDLPGSIVHGPLSMVFAAQRDV